MNNIIITKQLTTQDNIKDEFSLYSINRNEIEPTGEFENANFQDLRYDFRLKNKTNQTKVDWQGFQAIIPPKFMYLLNNQERMIDRMFYLKTYKTEYDTLGVLTTEFITKLIDDLINYALIPERFRYKVKKLPYIKNVTRLTGHKILSDGTKQTHIIDLCKTPRGDNLQRIQKRLKFDDLSITKIDYNMTKINIRRSIISLLEQSMKKNREENERYDVWRIFEKRIYEAIKLFKKLSEHSEGINFDEYIDTWAEKLLKK